MRLTVAEKREVIRLVEGADRSVRQTLQELRVNRAEPSLDLPTTATGPPKLVGVDAGCTAARSARGHPAETTTPGNTAGTQSAPVSCARWVVSRTASLTSRKLSSTP